MLGANHIQRSNVRDQEEFSMGQVLQIDDRASFKGIDNMAELGIAASRLAPGQKGVEHSHTLVEETTIVRSGSGRVQIEDRYYDLCPGSVAVIPAGEFHCITNTGAEPMEMVTVFNRNVDRGAVVLKNRQEHFGTAAGNAPPSGDIAALTAAIDELRGEIAALRAAGGRRFSPPTR